MLFRSTTVALNLTDMVASFITIYDVWRNQYFYMGETLVDELPSAMNFVVFTFVIVEMADDGNEGMTYGLLTTVSNLGTPFSRAISNQLFSAFTPDLSDSSNYIQDSRRFRHTVAISYGVSYACAFASLVFLAFLPHQKHDTQIRKHNWPRSNAYAVSTVVMVGIALVYSCIANFMTMFPDTMCSVFAGGRGC